MQPQDFCYWLKGFIELTDGQTRPSETQWECIRQHLDLVFDKQTPTPDQIVEILKQRQAESESKSKAGWKPLEVPNPTIFPKDIFIC